MNRKSKKAFFDNQDKEIACAGFTTLSVGDEIGPFTYTIGLFRSFKHPEMIIFGLPPGVAQGVLSDIAESAKKGMPFDLSKPTDRIFSDCFTCFVEVPKSVFLDYLLSAIRFNGGSDFPVFQVVWPSAVGKLYPWDPDADPGFVAMQPVLGNPCNYMQSAGAHPAEHLESPL